MLLDSQSLADFYDSSMGVVTRRLVLRRLRRMWPDMKATRLLGYGYAVPYLRSFALDSERTIALMPDQLGFHPWPLDHCLTAAASEEFLPFPDAMFDRVVMVHGVETAESVRPLMRQIWRVMAPAARLMIIAPNRASLWAQVDRSPFAHGRPFSRAQLDKLLRETMFVPEQWDTALLAPPFKSRRMMRTGVGWERLGRIAWPGMAGVHIVEATKSIYAVVPARPALRSKQVLAAARG